MSLETTDPFTANYPWISNAFFERILRREHQDNTIVVKDYTLEPAVGKGENFASQMLRVHVNYSSKNDPSADQISLIVKAVITSNAELAAIAAELEVLEIATYQQIIPRVEKLLRSIGDNSRLSAKCYEASEELSYLVFEDLSVLGYVNVNRRTGLDVEHFKHLLTKAAKWHAATAVLVNEILEARYLILLNIKTRFPHHRTPPLPLNFNRICYLLAHCIKPVMINVTNALVDVVKQMPGFEHFSSKLQRLSECVIQQVLIAAERDPNSFNVITHGDMWANNVMFSYDSITGGPTDAVLVDFQCGYFGSPVLDILYTLHTSSNETLCAKDCDEIVKHYHTELVRLLNQLGYSKPVPTLSELQADRLKRIHYSAMMGMHALGVRNLENVQDDGFVKFFGQSEDDHKYRVQSMLNPNIRKSLEFWLQYLADNGLLNV